MFLRLLFSAVHIITCASMCIRAADTHSQHVMHYEIQRNVSQWSTHTCIHCTCVWDLFFRNTGEFLPKTWFSVKGKDVRSLEGIAGFPLHEQVVMQGTWILHLLRRIFWRRKNISYSFQLFDSYHHRHCRWRNQTCWIKQKKFFYKKTFKSKCTGLLVLAIEIILFQPWE